MANYDTTETNGEKRHQELRRDCLTLAGQLSKPHPFMPGAVVPLTDDDVVDSAGKFFDFVMGGPSAAEDPDGGTDTPDADAPPDDDPTD